MMCSFKVVRWLIGGRWARVTGWFWGKRWVRVHSTCCEYTKENYTYGWPWQRLGYWLGRSIGL